MMEAISVILTVLGIFVGAISMHLIFNKQQIPLKTEVNVAEYCYKETKGETIPPKSDSCKEFYSKQKKVDK